MEKKRLIPLFLLLLGIVVAVHFTSIAGNLCPDGSQPKMACPSGYSNSNDNTTLCTAQPQCSVGTYKQDIEKCIYQPTTDVNGNYICDKGGAVINYGGSEVCGLNATCPDNGSLVNGQCIAYAQPTCNIQSPPQPNPFKQFCSKRCYDARTDMPKRLKLYSTDGVQNFSFKIKKGFSGWGEIRAYDDGCFIQGQYWKLCVQGNNLVETFVHPVSGKTYTVSAPIERKFWNTFSWSVNPNLVALFTRQHGTGKTTFRYVDLVYQPIDNDNPSSDGVTFQERFTPLTGDPYDFEYLEIQPGSLFSSPYPFCSEQIAQCLYNVTDVHAWIEHGRVFFGINTGLNSGSSNEVVYGTATYYRNEQEVADNTGDLFMSTPEHPEIGGAYRMWYSFKGAPSSSTVQPQKGCPNGYTLQNGECVGNGSCDVGTYDDSLGKCVSNANTTCPDGYTYNANAQICTADASCPNNGTLNFSTNQCETYLGSSCPGTYNLQGNQCVGSASCPAGTQLENGECVLSATTDCPTGYTYDASLDKCVANPQCPDNTTLDASTGQCVAQKSCTTTGGTCTAVHGTATKIYYTASDMKKYRCWSFEGWFGFERAGDNKIKFCINGYCGWNTIPLVSSSSVWSDWGRVPTNQADKKCPSGTIDERFKVRNVYVYGKPGIQSYRGCYGGPNYSLLGTVYGSLAVGSDYVDNVISGKCNNKYEGIEWFVEEVNDNGITNYKLCLKYGSPSTIDGYIYPQVEGTDSCIWAWVPYKCSQTGTVYKTQSQCQSNCSQTVCTCPDGTTQQGDQCIAQPVCPNGGSYDSSLNKCVASVNHCPNGYQYNSNNNVCYTTPTCEYGTYDSSTNQCVVSATTSCPSGYTQNGDKCTANPQCPGSGSYDATLKKCTTDISDNGCPSQSTYENGKCYSDPTCPNNGTWDATDNECKTGTTLSCPYGYSLQGGVCVRSSTFVGTDNMSSLTDFGITQTKTQNNITEEFGMEIAYPGLTPKKVGFIRKPSDFPSNEKEGYNSNRRSDWQPYSVGDLNWFFIDTGVKAKQCPSGQQLTDNGCFKDAYDLCPSGQVELYPDYKGQCFKYIEHAACWDGQTQFGNECYIKLSNTPNVCPSDGRNYTLLTPNTADYICKTTTQPSCPSGDIRDGNTCYRATNPSCPSGYTRQGGTCVKTSPANCPSGTQNIGGTCYHTAQPQCPSGYILTGNRQCSKDEWISGEVDDCYDANWNIIQFGQRLQCPSGYNKVTGLGRWYPVNGQAVGTCSSVSGTQNTAVGTHYVVCHATADATCPSGYSFNSNYQVTSTFTETGHSHDYYKKDGSLILFGQYRWDYNESSPSCGSLYDHTFTCYSDASVYGGFVDSTIENENAGKICFNTSKRDCTVTSDGCTKYEGSACPSGYTWNGQECEQKISACPNGSYDANNDKCITYDRQACDISPYDWTYDSSNDLCVHTTPAQCSPGERKKADNETWSACYQLDTSHGQPPGHIYCRNNLTYWDYGNREGCYQKEGVACDGHYQGEPNPDVILGSGNQYNEWTGRCWVKTMNVCPSNDELVGRGLFTTDYHCLKKNHEFGYITDNQTTPQEFGKYACNYAVDQLFAGQPNHVQCYYVEGQIDPKLGGGHDVWYDIYDPDTKVTKDYWPVCPIDPNSVCVWAGGELELCGTNKLCAGCYRFPENNEANADYYAGIGHIAYYNGAVYGLSYNQYLFSDAQKLTQAVMGRLPTSSDESAIDNAFKMSVASHWLASDHEDYKTYKYVVVIWDGSNANEFGFVAPCKFDDKGDMICTADMIECVNGQCPYGSQYPCQPLNGKEYCSKFSSVCKNMANPANAPQMDNVTVRDKKNDGWDNKTGQCLGQIYIFNGKTYQCRKAGLKTVFTNCCKDAYKKQGKILFVLPQCNKEDAKTDQYRDAGLCHEVGTYCQMKYFGICLQKAKTYCCFHSVLGRIVQEQGRAQLKNFLKSGCDCDPTNPQTCEKCVNWGKAKSPNCRGFTPEEFQMIDFDKIDLSEYFGKIEQNISKKVKNAQQNAVKNIQNFYNQIK